VAETLVTGRGVSNESHAARTSDREGRQTYATTLLSSVKKETSARHAR
jgi:hypothetical protein